MPALTEEPPCVRPKYWKGELMAEASLGQMIGPAVVLMGAAVVAVPLFRRIGLGSVLGYFAAGLLVGPSALSLITDAEAILHFSELGVVMFPFVIQLFTAPRRSGSACPASPVRVPPLRSPSPPGTRPPST